MLRYAALPRSARDLFIFRGHSNSEWRLQSTLDRNFGHLPVPQRAAKLSALIAGFSNELYGLDGNEPVELNEGIELLGRHHGLPTTVIDWTRSPYVAGYFAFESDAVPAPNHVAVLAFDRRGLKNAPVAGDILINEMNLVGSNMRAIQQRGVFLRLPVGEDAENSLAAGLWKYTIPHSERKIALSDLDEMLITARTLFRDRDSAARTAFIREALI